MSTDYKRIEAEARAELAEFLNENPQLAPLQADIEKLLESVGDDPYMRAQYLTKIMLEVLNQDLVPEMNRLLVRLKNLEKGPIDKAS